MAMPEAAMNEDDPSMGPVREIGPAGQITIAYRESETVRIGRSAHKQLGCRVFLSDTPQTK